MKRSYYGRNVFLCPEDWRERLGFDIKWLGLSLTHFVAEKPQQLWLYIIDLNYQKMLGFF